VRNLTKAANNNWNIVDQRPLQKRLAGLHIDLKMEHPCSKPPSPEGLTGAQEIGNQQPETFL